MLSKSIIKLKQEINSLGYSCPLNEVKPDFVDKLELESKNDNHFKSIFDKMCEFVMKCNKCIEDYESLSELRNFYSEAYIYSKLKSLLVIEKFPKVPHKAPDFKVIFRDSSIYIEMKSLNMVHGIYKHHEIMQRGLEKRIDLETQINRGESIAISEQVIQPYKSGKLYDNRSQHKMIIKTLIQKITENLKKGQFNEGDTLLLVNIGNQLTIPDPESAIYENYTDRHGKKLSGVLWHTAFGRLNSQIYRFTEFENTFDTEPLGEEGILNTNPFIKGLIFHIDENFYALSKSSEENIRVIELMNYLCPKTTVLYG